MEHFALELHKRRLVGVFVIEIHLQSECSALPNSIESAVYDCLPLVEIIFIGHSIDALVVVLLDLLMLLHQFSLSVCGHLATI